MYSELTLKEFEWYLRDLFFRSSKSNREISILKKENVAENLKKYLRYKNLEILEIYNLLDIVLDKMHNDNIIKINEKNIEFRSKIERKQCDKCFYINYLFENEIIKCKRCNSPDLKEFPKKKDIQ